MGTWDWHVPTGEVIFNERWAEMLGYTLAEIEPHVRSWEKLLHPDDAPAVTKILTAHLEGDTPLYQTEHRLLAKSGEWRWILDTGKVFTRDERGQPIRVVGTHQDITERKRAEAERERLLAAEREQRLQAETLAEVVLALTSHIDVEEVLDEILRQAQRVVPFITANIALLEGDSFYIVRGYGYEAFGCADLVATLGWPLTDLPLDAEAIQARKALVVLDTCSEPRWVKVPGTEWIRSFLMVPICLHERVLGVLHFDSDVAGQFTVEDAERLQPLVNAAAVALEGARLYDQVRQELAERTWAERELRQSEARHRALLHAVPDMILRLTREGIVVDLKPPADHVSLGFQLEGAAGDEVHKVVPAELADWILDCVRRTLDAGAMQSAEFQFPTSQGTRDYEGRFVVSGDNEVCTIVRDVTDRKQAETEREKLIAELQAALVQVRRLSGLLPICASCKKIRDDTGYWQQVEVYIRDHAEVEFSHGICPDCREKLYPRGDYPYLYTEPTERGDENLPGATR